MNRRISYVSVEKSPEAFLTINKNKVKPGRDGAYYLENGQSFELRIENNTLGTFLAKLSWNGQDEKSGLVLKPAQTIYLERFVDTNNRLTFKSLDIPKELEDHVDSALGQLEVKFYKEVEEFNMPTPFIPEKRHPFSPTYTPPSTPTFPPISPYWYDNTGEYHWSNNTTAGVNQDRKVLSKSFSSESSVKIGKIEKGGKTSQNFKESNKRFENTLHGSTLFRLKPLENKPADMLVRKYCSGCGAKRKNKWKFCPYCGEKN